MKLIDLQYMLNHETISIFAASTPIKELDLKRGTFRVINMDELSKKYPEVLDRNIYHLSVKDGLITFDLGDIY